MRLMMNNLRIVSPVGLAAWVRGEAGDELRGKQRNGRGDDVGRACVHTGQHQRRKSDECAAASERILHPRPHRGDEEDNEGVHRGIRSGVPAEGGRTFYSRGGRKGKLSPSAIAHLADRVIKQTINGTYNGGIGGVSDLSQGACRRVHKRAANRSTVGMLSAYLRGEKMKAKLLLSAAVIGLIAMSPAIAETVIVPVIPGSLDGANSTTGDGGNGKDAAATANSPSDSTNSAFATGGAGGSGVPNGGNGGPACASATTMTTDASGNSSSLSSATGGDGGPGNLGGNGGAPSASATTTTPGASGTVSATTTATGGTAGGGNTGGNGGDATAAANAIGGSGPVNVSASAIGGNGGLNGGDGGSAQLSSGGAGPAVFGQSSGGPVPPRLRSPTPAATRLAY